MLFLYDNTYDGLLTAVFHAFEYRGGCSVTCLERQEGPVLFDCAKIETDAAKADRVTTGMMKLDSELPETVYRAWLSELSGIEDSIIAALRLGFAQKQSPLPLRGHPCVFAVQDAAGKVGKQAAKYEGLLRFVSAGESHYAADIDPDYHVLPLLGQHFHDRWNDSYLLIRDTRRRLAVVSEPAGWHIAPLPGGELPPLPDDTAYTDLWRKYFNCIANPARKNLALQQKFVPLKFRKNLPEFN
jgi:probable DNA metabolism protein